jgi:tetratricopeptide (TPR) repeat protein
VKKATARQAIAKSKATKPKPKAKAKPTTRSTSKAKAGTAGPRKAKAKASAPVKKRAQVSPELAALATRAAAIEGRFCYGLPLYERNAKLEFRLVTLGDLQLFEDNEVDRDQWAGWIPFATLGTEPQFLCIQTAAPHAVGVWEHEDGEVHTAWDSLDEFAARALASKRDKTIYEQLDALLEQARALIHADREAEALALLEPACAQLPPTAKRDEQLATLYNFLGLALKGLDRPDDAVAAFEHAAAAGDRSANLNIMAMLLEIYREPRRALDLARSVQARGCWTAYECTWVAIYVAQAALDLGDVATAEQELRELLGVYQISDPVQIVTARTALEDYIAEQRPGAAAAQGFLAWFAPKVYAVSSAEAAVNRAWWDALAPALRAKLFEEVKLEGEPDEATDEQIARCLDTEACDLEEEDGAFDDLTPFLRLTNLQRLSFTGDPDSLEPLRALSKLARLTINGNVVKDFAWPSRAQRDLWKAAAAGSREDMQRALVAGAAIDARTPDEGKTAFHHVEDEELALWLVEQGADPYAGNHGDGGGFQVEYWEEARKQRAFAAMAKFGHPPIEDSPWRELAVESRPKGASFLRPSFKIDGKSFDKGDSLVAVWPADASLAMRPPQREHEIHDVMRVQYDDAVVSERVAAVLRADPNIELLPITLLDHGNQPVPGTWYFVNPLVKECLVIDRCAPSWNHIDPDSATEIASFVIDPGRVGDAQLFRPAVLNARPMIATRALADQLARFDGVRLAPLKR